MALKWATIEWTFMARISTDFICYLIWSFNLRVLLLSPFSKTRGNSCTHFSTFMATQTRKAVSCSATRSITSAFKLKVSFSPNTCHQFVSIWSSRLAISAKSKCRPETKVKTCQSKAVPELLFINGLTLHIATLWRLAFSKM
jgi:hypothetical protein